MCIQDVILTLQNKGRAISRDIAKSAGIDSKDAITALLKLEKRGVVTQKNGYWWLAVEPITMAKPTSKRTRRGS